MKTYLKKIITVVMCFFVLCISIANSREDLNVSKNLPGVSFTFQIFYDELSPYGSWVTYPDYGYVWVPRVSGFVPYGTSGYWVASDYGWTWVSDFRWGWAPFHYGRWFLDDVYGWIWVPGYEWAPAWVVWGKYNTYYGWAPLGPNVAISAAYVPPAYWWVYVPAAHITQVNVYRYSVRNTTIASDKVTVIRNTEGKSYYYGPRVSDVEKVSGKKVTRVAVTESTKPGATRTENNKLVVYRPDIRNDKGDKVAPSKLEKLENLKPVNGKNNVAPTQRQNTIKGAQEKKTTEKKAPELKKQEPRPTIEKKKEQPIQKTPDNKSLMEKKTAPERKSLPQNKRHEIKKAPQQQAPSQKQIPQREFPVPQKQIPQQDNQKEIPPPQREIPNNERQQQMPPPQNEIPKQQPGNEGNKSYHGNEVPPTKNPNGGGTHNHNRGNSKPKHN